MKYKVSAIITADFDCGSKEDAEDCFKDTIEGALEADDFYNMSFDKVSAIPAPKKFAVTMRWEKLFVVEATNEPEAIQQATLMADSDDEEVRSLMGSYRTTFNAEEKA